MTTSGWTTAQHNEPAVVQLARSRSLLQAARDGHTWRLLQAVGLTEADLQAHDAALDDVDAAMTAWRAAQAVDHTALSRFELEAAALVDRVLCAARWCLRDDAASLSHLAALTQTPWASDVATHLESVAMLLAASMVAFVDDALDAPEAVEELYVLAANWRLAMAEAEDVDDEVEGKVDAALTELARHNLQLSTAGQYALRDDPPRLAPFIGALPLQVVKEDRVQRSSTSFSFL